MFGQSATPYDLRFQALGIPVRVHPMFWLFMALIGWRDQNIPAVLVFIGAAFVSVLVHEFGHGLTARAFGSPASIVLWGFGGLCYSNSDRQTPLQRLAVVAFGPGAGFLFCGVVMALFSVFYGLKLDEQIGFGLWSLFGAHSHALESAVEKLGYTERTHEIPLLIFLYSDLIFINIMWGLLNILPMWPLDGGRITEIVLSQLNPFNGRRWTHIISMLTAGLLAIAMYRLTGSLLNTILFAYLVVMNYQMLDSIHRAQSLGLYDDQSWRT